MNESPASQDALRWHAALAWGSAWWLRCRYFVAFAFGIAPWGMLYVIGMLRSPGYGDAVEDDSMRVLLPWLFRFGIFLPLVPILLWLHSVGAWLAPKPDAALSARSRPFTYFLCSIPGLLPLCFALGGFMHRIELGDLNDSFARTTLQFVARNSNVAIRSRIDEVRRHLEHTVLKYDGRFPPLSATPGKLMFEFYDSEISYIDRSRSPYFPIKADPALESGNESEDPVNDAVFYYLGYEIQDEEALEAFALAYLSAIRSGRDFKEDLPAAAQDLPTPFRRLRLYLESPVEAVDAVRAAEDFFERAQKIPVIIERPDRENAKGGHVYFLDGHTEFIPFPGHWPMTEKAIGILNRLDALGNVPGTRTQSQDKP